MKKLFIFVMLCVAFVACKPTPEVTNDSAVDTISVEDSVIDSCENVISIN